MAEINKPDVISEEALKAPLEFAENWGKVELSLDSLLTKFRIIEGSIGKSTSTTKLKTETDQLTVAQVELNKITKQIQAVQAKNNAEYIKQAKVLNDVKKSLKEKTALGDLDARTVTAQNASIPILTAALAKNRAAYDSLTNAEERNSIEGKQLLAIINEQDAGLKGLKKSYGQSQLEVGNYENATKNLKLELKAAQDQMLGIGATLGVESAEFAEAAAKAGELKNELGDLQASVKAVAGSKFENISTSLGLVGSKLKALDFKGAASAGRQLVAATKALTFKEAVAGAGDFGKTMLSLGKALLLNPIFLLVAALVGIGAAVFKLKDSVPFISKAFDAVGASLDYVIQKGKDFLDLLGLTEFAADDKAKKVIDAAEKEIEAVTERYDREIKLAEAAGKETLAIEIEKQKALISTAAKSQQELFGIWKRYGKLQNDEQQARWDANIKIIGDANIEIQALQLKHEKELADKAREKALREAGDAYKLNQFLLQLEIDRQKAILENDKKGADDRINASIELDSARRRLAKLNRDNELREALLDENHTADQIKLIHQKFQKELTDITAQGVKGRSDVAGDTVQAEKERIEKAFEVQKEGILKTAEAQQRALDEEIDAIKKHAIAKGVASDEVDKIILDKQKRLADDSIEIQIKALEKILKVQGISAQESAAIDKQLYDLRRKLTDTYYEQLQNKEKTWIEKAEGFIAKYKQAFGDAITGASDLFSAFTDRKLQKLDQEDEANETTRNRQIEREKEALEKSLEDETLTAEQKDALKENSAKREEAIEKAAELRAADIEKRRRAAIRKQAIFDKSVAIAMATINLAQAILAMLKVGPAGFALSAIAAATGAVQLATIVARPIPAAQKGLKGHKGGPILAGEAGDELVRMGNQFALTQGKGVYNLPPGAEVYNHDKTIRMLAMSGVHASARRNSIEGNAEIKKELRGIKSAIKNKREFIVQGRIAGYTVGSQRIKYLESLRNK